MMIRTKIVEVTVYCPDQAVAEKIADRCVRLKLAACANVSGTVESLYRWKGELEKGKETVLKLKTRAELLEAVEKNAREIHPDEVPCILAKNLDGANEDYEQWLVAQTSSENRA